MDDIALLLSCSPAGGVTAKNNLQVGIPPKQPSGCSGLLQLWTCLWDAPEDTKVVHVDITWPAAMPSTAQIQMFLLLAAFPNGYLSNATILIPRTYKYLHHDWHVVVFLITTSSFPLIQIVTDWNIAPLRNAYIFQDCVQGDFRLVLWNLQGRSYGKLSRRRLLSWGAIWAWAVCSHWLPAQSYLVLVPWPLPCLTWPHIWTKQSN